MAFYIGSTNFFPGIYPMPSAASTGAPLVANTTEQGYWAYPGASLMTPSGALQYRSIFTHGYVAGGYKDGTPWRSVNKTWHANDVTIYCGEQIQTWNAYGGGTFSDYNGYCHGSYWNTASTETSSYSLSTGVSRTMGAGISGAAPGGSFGYTGNNPSADGIAYGSAGAIGGVGSWDLSAARTYFGGTQNQLSQIGYIAGGSQTAATDKFNFSTEIMYTTNSHTGNVSSHATGGGGSSTSYWSFAGALRTMTFASDTWGTWSPGVSASTDGVCKILTTKLGYHYVGSSSNATQPMMKWNDSTGTVIRSDLNKPTAQGEENMEMGQNWGYCLGAYNGLQNNYTFKVNYLTDSISALGNVSQPKGHAGMSSGQCSSASASVAISRG